jgi:hypothetical protein
MYEFEKRKLLSVVPDGLDEPLANSNAIIAGGAVSCVFTNREINDLDIYFHSKEDLNAFLYNIEDSSNRIVSKTEKSILIVDGKQCVQLIYFKYFPTIDDLFNSFDFTVVMGAYDFATDEFILHPDFLKDNAQRILKFNPDTSYPIISLLRVDKYKKYGYTISKSEFLRIALTCMGLDIPDYESFKSHIGGMYGVNYDNILNNELEKDKFDLKNIVAKMADLNLHDEYFNMPKEAESLYISNYDEFVTDVTGLKPYGYKWVNGKYYNYKGHPIDNPEKYEIEDMSEVPQKYYKYVLRTDEPDKYKSLYHNFYYTFGEFAKAENSHCGLYFHFAQGLDMYWVNKENYVLVECEVSGLEEYPNEFHPAGEIRADKAKIVKVFTEEEAKKLVYGAVGKFGNSDELPF